MALTKEALLALGALKPRLVPFSFDGVSDEIWVKPQSAAEFQQEMAFIKSLQIKEDGESTVSYERLREIAAYKVSKQLVDDAGVPMLTLQDALQQSNEWLTAVDNAIRSTFKESVAETAKK